MGAVVIKQLLEAQQIDALLALAEDKMVLVGSPERKKHRHQVPNDFPEAETVAQIVLDSVRGHELFLAATYPEAFSPPRLLPYGPGMGYRDHLDNPHMGGHDGVRTDISVTIGLTQGSAYDGGDLVIDSDRAERRWKGNAGDCLVYPGDSVHRVEPVTRGVRLVCIFWIQSMVRDATQRDILFELASGFSGADAASESAENTSPLATSPGRETMRRCHGSLLRMWAGR